MKRRCARIIAMLMFLLAAPPLVFAKGVVLNFTDVDIATMVKFVSDLTGKNFIMDDRVKGKISVFSPAKLSNEEAYNVFTSVLELKGFTVVPAGKVLKIVPTSSARQSGMRILSDGERSVVNDSYQARVIQLEHVAPQDAVTFLQPLVSKDGQISAFGAANMILVVDSAFNIQKVLGILKHIDTDQVREGAELVFLKNAAAESVATLVKDWMSGKSSKGGAPGAAATNTASSTVVPDNRLNALIIFGSDKDKTDVKKLIALVDVVPPTTSSKVNVYYLENAEAAEVAKVLDGLLKGTAATPAPAAGAAATAPQQAIFEGGKITITPDKSTNSLVIMASPTDYQNLLQVIQKLDRRSRQVFVQAMIAEVSANKAKELGLQWGVVTGASNGTLSTVGTFDPFGAVAGLTGTLTLAGQLGITPPDAGVALFPATLKALQSNGALNVLSTPNIMTSDNKEAEIFVGENVPFLSGTNLTSTGLSQQSIERKDTGIILKIKPQISEGEYIKLDIYQEISAVKDFGTATNPNLGSTKRSAKTSVVVKNTDTVIIGGLIQDTDQVTESKIPLLGDIPLLGWLFKTKKTTRDKTNLLIMLTPRIIKDARDMAEVSVNQRNAFSDAVKTSEPINLEQALKEKPKSVTEDKP
ncbi:type II secretion system protein GspD, putative [Citrifermentans bemidjiense Bem]|uniref:Type II secretion system protein GspD, putative n=1 Tax=Citrifermentans bemidjiense (strain ATCC BAA-1014 / DSM 16622 / JCM 12645 / Bem) TaxID=404380 RepID=B5ED37_CITBB|nr:type II secretion system protein GspD, putative [Citrifermentans bemidjiense Bem]